MFTGHRPRREWLQDSAKAFAALSTIGALFPVQAVADASAPAILVTGANSGIGKVVLSFVTAPTRLSLALVSG